MIEAQGLVRRYGDFTAVHGISFTVSDGENILPINELGHQLGKHVLEQWLDAAHRRLNNYQVLDTRTIHCGITCARNAIID